MHCLQPPLMQRPRQRGIALFVVIVFVLLSMLLALWASRTSLFNEMVVGNDADYQRAFEAAQALLQDAELDIREEKADGSPCTGSTCRNTSATAYKLPNSGEVITQSISALNGACHTGVCPRRTGAQDFWNDKATLAAMTQDGVGARYGEFTGAQLGSSSSPINPILTDRSANDKGGWYWIEIIPYSDNTKTQNLIVDDNVSQLKLNLDVYVVFRITALAYGRKPGTMVVLQQTYARQRTKG